MTIALPCFINALDGRVQVVEIEIGPGARAPAIGQQCAAANSRAVLLLVTNEQRKGQYQRLAWRGGMGVVYGEQLAAGSWDSRKLWEHPSPRRIGLDLGRNEQRQIVSVAQGSAARLAGVQVGDRLQSMNGIEVMTASDVMFQLDALAWEGGDLKLVLRRGEQHVRVNLKLAAAWKRGTPLSFSWRPSKWGLTPAPGFGGQQLTLNELFDEGLIESKQIKARPFALRVSYLVTWGANRCFGQAAAKAGLREGDVVLGVAGRRAFATPDHLHAWWRLECNPGELVKIELFRAGKLISLSLKVIE